MSPGRAKIWVLDLSLPTGLAKAKTYLQDDYLHDIQTNYDQRYFFYRAKCFHSFKRHENPHYLDLALCIVSGDVMYANCGSSCAAWKSSFCNHILALMLKVCKYTLYNCVNVTERVHERTRQEVITLMSQILLKPGTKVGCVKIITLTKNYVTILNSLGVTGTPPSK